MDMTPWGIFWTAFFGCLTATAPIMLGQVLTYRKQMAELRANSRDTRETLDTTIHAASKIIETAGKVESATKDQAQTATASAVLAKSAAKDARQNAVEAKDAGAATAQAVEKLTVNMNELKEIVNGYLTDRMTSAQKAGYALGAHDAIVKQVGEHTQRISNVETKLEKIDSKITTILDTVDGKSRRDVRGEGGARTSM